MHVLGALAALHVSEIIKLMHDLKRCAYYSSCGQKMALKIASLDSRKHDSLKLAMTAYCKREMCHNENAVMQAT